MTLSLNTILDRGRQYLAQADVANDKSRDAAWRIEVGLRALRSHSTAMADVSLDDGQALLAAVVGIVKWHERHAADGGHLGECLHLLEDAMASLEAHQQAEEAAACEPELPLYTRSARSLEYA